MAHIDESEIEALFTDWVDAEARCIAEHSGDIEADTIDLVNRARARADRMGLEWNEQRMVPSSVLDQIADWKTYDYDYD